MINAEVLVRTRGLLRIPLSTCSLLTDFWGDESCITLTSCSRDTNCSHKSSWQLINHHALAALLRLERNSVGRSQVCCRAQGKKMGRDLLLTCASLSSIMQAVNIEGPAVQMGHWLACFFLFNTRRLSYCTRYLQGVCVCEGRGVWPVHCVLPGPVTEHRYSCFLKAASFHTSSFERRAQKHGGNTFQLQELEDGSDNPFFLISPTK